MAVSKEYLYPEEDQQISHCHKALSHSARLAILKQLKSKGKMCVQVISLDHPISKESLSDHLKILREAQLVEWEERFPYTFYWVHEENLCKAKLKMNLFFLAFEEN